MAGVSLLVLLTYLIAEAMRVRGRSLFPITTVTNLCSRPEEAGRPAFGPVALTFGFVCSFALFRPEVASASIIITCIADSAAALLGRMLGRHRIAYSPKKTLEGSAASFLCALPFAVLWAGPAKGAAAAAAAALIESLPFQELDNLLPPIGVGCLLTVFGAGG